MQLRQPLFIQAVVGLKNLYDAKEVTIHIFGKKAEGDLKRPFKTGAGLFGSELYDYVFTLSGYSSLLTVETPGPSTDAAAIKAAEDAAKKGQ